MSFIFSRFLFKRNELEDFSVPFNDLILYQKITFCNLQIIYFEFTIKKYINRGVLMMDLNQILIEALKQQRINKGFSQDKLSELAGLDTKYINKLENGRFGLTIPTLSKILDALEISYDSFFSTLPSSGKNATNKLFDSLNSFNLEKREVISKKIQELLESIVD